MSTLNPSIEISERDYDFIKKVLDDINEYMNKNGDLEDALSLLEMVVKDHEEAIKKYEKSI